MIKKFFTLYIILLAATCAAHAGKRNDGKIAIRDLKATPAGQQCIVTMQVGLDSLHLASNHQVFVTPYLESQDGKQVVQLPSYLFSGRNMHYVYLRSGKTKATGKTKYTVRQEMLHKKGTAATVNYSETTPMQPWMLDDDFKLSVHFDTCGCGRAIGNGLIEKKVPSLNPLGRMIVMPYPQLVAEDDKIQKHEGRAKVQFEVDKFELHDQVYNYTHRVTRRKHTIDNRAQLQIIDDSLRYALSSPNVELVSLEICGYASPESPYDHNEYLALNRSRAVVEYIQQKWNIADSICSFRAVPENWAGFRQQVLAAKDITEQQRQDLLALIDRPIHSPKGYDMKEDELKTSPKFAALYRDKIHPDWFPELRYTQFSIATHLKPRTLEQLRQIAKTEPELMSLNQFYRVANSYEHGSEDFRQTLLTALRFFPNDVNANVNVASMLIEDKKYDEALTYVEKAGDTDEANTLRGIIATYKKQYDQARTYFQKATTSPEARRNLQFLQNL